jgi:2-isopropylmalate synthase
MAVDAAEQGKSVDDLLWAVPYLPVDPKDLGRSYEAVIRVNSQSGKGGVAYLLKTDHALDLPRKLQIEFSGVVQAKTDAEGGEVSSDDIWAIFQDEYLPAPAHEADSKWGRFELGSTSTSNETGGEVELTVTLRDGDSVGKATGTGNGPIAAFLDILNHRGISVHLYDYSQHTLSASESAYAAAYVELDVEGQRLWGVGIDADTTTASFKAVVSAVNRAVRASEAASAESDSLVSA